MKQLEEEFGMDRAIEIETDDEDDEAERVCYDNEDDDNESDITGLSRVPSHDFMDPDLAGPSWPQSCRQSLDMYTSVTPSVSFTKGSSFLIQAERPSQLLDIECPLLKPLISATNSDTEIVIPTSIPPIKLSGVSVFGASTSELPLPRQCSYSQSLLNATNALCGIGILSTPFALKEGGWIGILLLFLIGVIACYTGILLKRCLESSSQLQTYPDIGQAAFGLGGRICIAIILYIELYSSCVEFLIMMSDNLSATFPNAQVDIGGIHLDSYQICAIVARRTRSVLPGAVELDRRAEVAGCEFSVPGHPDHRVRSPVALWVPGEVQGSDAVHCFMFGKSDLLGIEAYIIRHHHQQNVWVEFDLEKSRIGVVQVRCDLAGQKFKVRP